VITAEEFFIGPHIDYHPHDSDQAEEILVAIRHPGNLRERALLLREVADRNVWDFPLVNCPLRAIVVKNGVIDKCPHRLWRRELRAASPHGGRADREGQGRSARTSPSWPVRRRRGEPSRSTTISSRSR